MKCHRLLVLNLTLASLPLLVMAGCSTGCPCDEVCPVPFVAAPARAPAPAGVWLPDQVSAYTVGRMVDPRDPNVVHEAHTLYRREQTSRPNLAPPFLTMPPALPPQNPAP